MSIPFMERRLLFSSAGIYVASAVVTKAIAFFLYPLYTRFVSPSDYGILGVVDMTNGVLFILMTVGLGGSINRFYIDYAKEPEKLKEYLGTIAVFLLIFPLALSLFIDWQGRILFNGLLAIRGVPYHPYFRLGIWSMYLSILSIMPLSLLVMRGQALKYFWINISVFIINQILILLFVVWAGKGALGFLNAALIGSAVTGVLYLWMTIKEIKVNFNLHYLKESLLFSLPLLPHLISQWGLLLIDRYILEKLRPLSEIGVYSFGYQLALIMSVVVMGVSNAWAPYFYKNAGEESQEVRKHFGRLQLEFIAVVAVIAVIGILFAEELVTALFPKNYHLSADIIPVIVLAYVVFGLYLIIGTAIFYKKRHKIIPVITSLAALVNIILNLVWIPKFGITGAAYATLFGYLALLLPVAWWSQKVYPIGRNIFQWSLVLIGLLIIFLSWAFNLFNLLHGLAVIVAAKFLLLVVYGTTVWYIIFKRKTAFSTVHHE